MNYIYIGAAIVIVTLLAIIAYLYRESAIISGKSEIGIGPLKLKLASAPQQETSPAEPPVHGMPEPPNK